LSRFTTGRRIAYPTNNIKKAANLQWLSSARDESTGVSDTAQLDIFVRGIYNEFIVTEELAGLMAVKGKTTS
jgi:hypothetical protein